jgi:hypothetical protein
MFTDHHATSLVLRLKDGENRLALRFGGDCQTFK